MKAAELVRLRRGALRVDERVERALRTDEGSRDEADVEAAERRMARIIAAEWTRRQNGGGGRRGGGKRDEMREGVLSGEDRR